MGILILFTVCVAAWAAIAAIHLLAGRLVGMEAAEVRLFFGPRIAAVDAGGIRWQLGTVPLGSSVRFTPESVERAGRTRHAAMILVVPPLLLLTAWACAPAEALDLWCSTPGEILLGAWSPVDRGAPLLRSAVAAAADGPLLTSAGRVLAVFGGLGLLPLPSLAVGQAILLFLPGGARSTHVTAVCGWIAACAISLSWLYATVLALLG